MKNIRLNNMTTNDRTIFSNIVGAFLVKGGALIVLLISTSVFIRLFDD